MTHLAVYEIFKTFLPHIAEKTEAWFQNGKNSIRIRTTDKRDYVFTYSTEYSWSFETVDSYIKHMKGEKKMR